MKLNLYEMINSVSLKDILNFCSPLFVIGLIFDFGASYRRMYGENGKDEKNND